MVFSLHYQWRSCKYETITLQRWTGYFGASECIPWPSVILMFSLQRRPAHVTVNPTAVTQRGESLARHRRCNLTQYFSPSPGCIKSLYMCYWLLCQQTAATQHDLLSRSDTLWIVVEPWKLGDEPKSTWHVHDYVFFPFLSPSGGDESQVALAIVLASSQDCGVYGCSISNEYGTDTTDFLLSVDSKIQYAWRHQMWNLHLIISTVLLWVCFLFYSSVWDITKRWFGR